jgi:tetratricopeptide (TPR) repeat protein
MSESEEVLAAVPVIEVSEEQKQLGEKFKAEGNEFFKNKHFVLAVDSYTKAIEANPRSAVYFSNRAFARIRLEEYGSAIQDATEAIAIDKNFIKAYYRRADANLGIGKYQVSVSFFFLPYTELYGFLLFEPSRIDCTPIRRLCVISRPC